MPCDQEADRRVRRYGLGVTRCLTTSLALVVAGLLVLAPAAGAAATRAEYAAQADPFCAAANKDIGGLNKRADAKANKGKYGAAGKLLSKTGRRLSSSIEEVRAIVPPPGDEQLIADWLGLIERIAANNVKLGKAVGKQKFKKADKIGRSSDKIGAQAQNLVVGFPFQSCA